MSKQDDYSFVSSEDFGKAVLALLKKPALDFSRDLKKQLDSDPKHLEHQEIEIVQEIKQFLDGGGVYWDEKIIQTNLRQLVKEVMVGLRSIER